MKNYRAKKDAPLIVTDAKHGYYKMMDETTGCGGKVWTAIGYNRDTEYHFGDVHDDMEVFLVLEGSGWATIGEEEFHIEKDTCFAVPAGVRHGTRCENEEKPLLLYWFHAPQPD